MGTLFYNTIVILVSGYKSIEKTIMWLAYPILTRWIDGKFQKHGLNMKGEGPLGIKVKEEDKEQFYLRLANNASMGLGETYMEGIWDSKHLDDFLLHIFKDEAYKDYLHPINRLTNYLLFKVCNLQTKARCWEVGQKHYDKGNDLFEAFLDPTMNYSCGYWKNARDLNQAQLDKMDLIGRKLMLKPGMRVLDIGCGWGGLCKYLAEKYKVQVVGCTISKEQADIARENCKDLPVDIRLVDYRDLNEKFDRIVSVGMFEHVGPANYRTFFEVAAKSLSNEGILLLHTIGVSHQDVPLIEPWFHKYIFPNGMLPYHTQIPQNIDGLFILEDWHNFGVHYARTLRAWRENFVKAWPTLAPKYGEVFYRMWYYYLSLSMAAFTSRKYQLWQVVLTKDGREGGYEAPR